ncbi:hypothetical protein OEG79_08500 [Pseudomonas sp. Z8(2022)]|uniref:hypothetical protein n=1 Tax=Pseudomonas sp. Z8(2022) TaxID=2962597 RepID=UPI0021F47E8E|nr:hypothetical protein [Pseudomonas sp. Z8(2022)]UYP32537.1 hypothetical protein OEG79_08500 [Pseudomonas sp. Z8(2022)]
MLIAYANQAVENNKLEKARQRADLLDRIRRCQNISERMPGQLMTPQLKLLLSKLQLQLNERLLPLDKKNTELHSEIATLKTEVAKGESIAVKNPPQPIANEAKAKDIRFLLENLHALITGSVQNGLLPANEGKHWLKQIRQMLVQVHIEFFSTLGQTALQQNHPGQARLAFERGVQYLRKQPDPAPYQAQLKRFEEQLARANALVLNRNVPSADEPSQLTEGLKDLEDDWKKKNIYD